MFGDTLIDLELYSKIYQINDTIIDHSIAGNYTCAIRESSDSCIFRINSGYTEKLKLFDYSLNLNDTISLDTDAGLMNYELTDRGSVILNQDNYTEYIGSFDEWIDGIGNTSTGINRYILPKPAMIDYMYDLMTFKLDNVLIYGVPFSNYLNLMTSQNDLSYNSEKVYPNPCSVNSTVQIEHVFPIDFIYFYDLNGCMISQISGENKKSINISLNNINPGIYILRLKSISDEITNYKMIVK